jgi:cell fate regulator YaaT (PSP1 superfamily)
VVQEEYEAMKKEDPSSKQIGTFSKWFDFTVDYLDKCMDRNTFGEDCANKMIKNNNINQEKVNRCLQNSFVRNP